MIDGLMLICRDDDRFGSVSWGALCYPMTLMILVGEGKGCTRHLTNSLSTQPDDDDDVDDDDVAALA